MTVHQRYQKHHRCEKDKTPRRTARRPWHPVRASLESWAPAPTA
eukprot:CAMPEP_0204312908 /NCGR_PEP_ID=MMETSP0469-20131031/3271_1 /ASSEMBLY_ACC=CAM_ASM_000384 /TAXON_ID=2969 /ORGANISM="Oxyrrhis marina" /LENGTH=43 /DNA_ID= /DNA_START= /DNA_END= /DNA_ORIENTATION=